MHFSCSVANDTAVWPDADTSSQRHTKVTPFTQLIIFPAFLADKSAMRCNMNEDSLRAGGRAVPRFEPGWQRFSEKLLQHNQQKCCPQWLCETTLLTSSGSWWKLGSVKSGRCRHLGDPTVRGGSALISNDLCIYPSLVWMQTRKFTKY